MIGPTGVVRVMVATKPVDFRKGAEGLAALVRETMKETCKLNGVDPNAYLADVITKIVNDHPNSRIDEILPWAYPVTSALKDVA